MRWLTQFAIGYVSFRFNIYVDYCSMYTPSASYLCRWKKRAKVPSLKNVLTAHTDHGGGTMIDVQPDIFSLSTCSPLFCEWRRTRRAFWGELRTPMINNALKSCDFVLKDCPHPPPALIISRPGVNAVTCKNVRSSSPVCEHTPPPPTPI